MRRSVNMLQFMFFIVKYKNHTAEKYTVVNIGAEL